jgi:hypothetical protein
MLLSSFSGLPYAHYFTIEVHLSTTLCVFFQLADEKQGFLNHFSTFGSNESGVLGPYFTRLITNSNFEKVMGLRALVEESLIIEW